MTTLNEKQLIMSNLRKLKNATDTCRRLSITDDYTFEDRQKVRKKVIEAKNKTEVGGDGKYVWKVRGTPKNGLELYMFTAKKQENPLKSDYH